MEELLEQINEAESADLIDNLDPDSITPFEMTYKYYNRLWAEAQEELAYLVHKEPPPDEPPELVPTRLVLVRRATKLYLKYIAATNKLITCYEHMAHPQKRRLLRKGVDASIGRVLELKQDLAALENSDYHFLDQMLISLRMTPKDMDIKVPEYFRERTDEEDERSKMVELNLDILAKQKRGVLTERMKFIRMAMAYIRMLQAHERSRQARELFQEHQKKSVVKELNRRREARKNMQINKPRQTAAITIQRAWRLCMLRKSLKKEYIAEMTFLGMLPQSGNRSLDYLNKDRLDIIERNEKEYQTARKSAKSELLTYKAPDMMEDLENETRSYFHSYFEIYGAYPDFPEAEDGGSTKMFEISVDLEELEKEAAESEDTKSESKKDTQSEKSKDSKSSKDSKDTKSSKDSKSKDGKGKDDEGPAGYSLKPSKFLIDLASSLEEYSTVWKGKKPVNFDRFDEDMLKEDILKEVELEVRIVVDDKMRLELQRLSEAFQKDSKKAKGKKGKGKKGKGKDKEKKGKKGKKEKDLTPDRTLESLTEELVQQEIIKSYPKYRLCDFICDYNCSGSLQHLIGDPDKDPLPCLGDVRRVVSEYCILPMGSDEIHANADFVKSILFAGPNGVGKKSLVYTICNEINATLMDLSAENIEGKYPGKEGKEMLLHLVLKVGRALQPTIVFIKDAENYFYKKKPPSCTLSDPGRLKKDLPKLIKGIKNEDRILICGTTVVPFDVDLKGLGGSYGKVICILKPDYNCRRSLWRDMIRRHKGILTRKMDMSVLCNLSDGFTAAAIEESVKEALTERRLSYQRKIPLTAVEFLACLAKHVPVYEEENEAYKQWLDKMPLRKKRIALLESERDDTETVEEESDEED